MSDFNIEEKVEIVKDMLYGVAKFDGKVTLEEERLIEAIAEDIHEYFQLLADVYTKEKPTSLDRANLFRSRLKIISKSVKTIREDMRVTPDEKELFRAIQELLPELPPVD